VSGAPDAVVGSSRRREFLLLSLVALTLLGELVRELGLAFQGSLGTPLNGDLPGFVQCARDMRWFYDSGLREPLPVLLIKLGLWLGDDVERGLRLRSVLETLLCGALLLWAGRRLLGTAVGVLALALFCVNPVVVFYGVSGLRDTLFGALLLAFAAALFTQRSAPRAWRADVGCGLLAAALVLTRVHGWIIVVGAVGLWLLRERAWRPERRRPTLQRALVTLLLGAALFAPYPLASGDRAFTHPANFWRNIERHGEPRDFLREAPISTLDYVFENRTLVDVVARTGRNLLLYQTLYLPHYLQALPWLAWLLPLGLAVSLLSRRWHVAALLPLSLAQVVFILDLSPVAGHRGVEMRFVLHAFPLALLVLAHGLAWPLGRALAAVQRRRPSLERWLAPIQRLLLPSAEV
jgi:4-amino-4-deoxy-L-arabinose transferase-like glycosyltransferase